MFPHAYEVLDTVSETWCMVHGKKVPQVRHIYKINFCYGNIDAINAEEKDENIGASALVVRWLLQPSPPYRYGIAPRCVE
jgi:hypothetical protein